MPIALLDADGPLIGFVEGLIRELGPDAPPLEKFHSYKLSDVLTPAQWARAQEIMLDYHFWEALPSTEGASRAVDVLKRLGYTIVVATAPWRSCVGWDHARRKLLHQRFGIARERVISVDAELKPLIQADIFVDDKPDTVKAWQVAHPFGRAYLYASPWNKHEEQVRRWVWMEIVEVEHFIA